MVTFKNSFVIITIDNFFFVDVMQHLKILQIVFRPKKLIKANYKASRMKVSKGTFRQSFKFHNYWVGKKAKKPYMHIYKYTHANKRTHIPMHK